MKDRRNVFDDILHDEDAVTDTLRHFLTYGSVQEALWETLPDCAQKYIRSSSIQDIQTRATGGHSDGYPDLVIYGSDLVLVVEVKVNIWRPLTCHQKAAYIPWLKEEMAKSRVRYGMVVFLIPDGYAHEEALASSLVRAKQRAANSKIEVLPSITWQKLVENLGLRNVAPQNELMREFYNHLYKRFEPVSFSEEEIMPLGDRRTAIAIRKLLKVVEGVSQELRNKPNCPTPRRITTENGDVGFYVSLGQTELWIGIWCQYWEDYGSQLCLGVYQRNASKKTLDAFRQRHGDAALDGHLVKGYPLKSNQNSNILIQEIIEDIEDLLKAENSTTGEGRGGVL